MAKSVTVTFNDGSSHTYDNVPDEVTDEQVTARAGTDFADKTATGVVGGIAPGSETSAKAEEPGLGGKLAGAAVTGYGLANELLGSPVGHALELAGGGAYALNKLKGIIGGPTAPIPPATPGATQNIINSVTSGAGEVPKASMGFVDTNAPRMSAPTNAPQQLTQGMARPAMTAMPGAGAGPAAIPEAPPSASNYMGRMTQLADKYLPAKAVQAAGQVGRALAPVARFAGSAPVLGAQLMMHSGSTGPQVPAAGPARGSEINPMTGRPWTAQELAAYSRQYR